MRILLCMILLCLPAMAQRRLWTWTSPAAADAELVSVIHCAATDSKGNTALVLGEFKFDWESPTLCKETKFRLLWISSTGLVLHEEVRPIESRFAPAMVAAVPGPNPWSVIVVNAGTWAVTDSRTIFTCTIKGKSKVARTTQAEDGQVAFPANATSTFAGWFQHLPGPTGSFWFGSETYNYSTTTELSLWSIK